MNGIGAVTRSGVGRARGPAAPSRCPPGDTDGRGLPLVRSAAHEGGHPAAGRGPGVTGRVPLELQLVVGPADEPPLGGGDLLASSHEAAEVAPVLDDLPEDRLDDLLGEIPLTPGFATGRTARATSLWRSTVSETFTRESLGLRFSVRPSSSSRPQLCSACTHIDYLLLIAPHCTVLLIKSFNKLIVDSRFSFDQLKVFVST